MGRFIFVLLLGIAAILYTVWLFEVVMASDLPGWLKYMILR